MTECRVYKSFHSFLLCLCFNSYPISDCKTTYTCFFLPRHKYHDSDCLHHSFTTRSYQNFMRLFVIFCQQAIWLFFPSLLTTLILYLVDTGSIGIMQSSSKIGHPCFVKFNDQDIEVRFRFARRSMGALQDGELDQQSPLSKLSVTITFIPIARSILCGRSLEVQRLPWLICGSTVDSRRNGVRQSNPTSITSRVRHWTQESISLGVRIPPNWHSHSICHLRFLLTFRITGVFTGGNEEQ